MFEGRVRSIDLFAHPNRRVVLKGWLHNLRTLGSVNFLIVRDGWGLAQCVVDKGVVQQLAAVQPESVLAVAGTVIQSAQAPGGCELHDCQVTLLEPVNMPVPFEINQQKIKANLDTFLNHAQLGLRHPRRRALLRLGGGLMAGFRQTLMQAGFTEIQSPKLVAAATEGGANVFAVDYFGRPAFLAQSPQFYKQMMVGVFERVFEVGPVFRAEPHNTSRHINEYVSLDVEFGFIEDHTTVMALATQVIQGMLAYLDQHHRPTLETLGLTLPVISDVIPALHFAEAQQLLFEASGVDNRSATDLTPQQERWLGTWAKETYRSEFLFVTGYPLAKRPFYTYPSPVDPHYSNSFDLLFRGLELITGGQRLHRYADYLAALTKRGLPIAGFEPYLEAFRYGMPPHGGFAIGLERMLMQLTGVDNIRAVALFPRDSSRLLP